MKTIKEIKSKKSGWILTLAIAVAASGFVFAIGPPGSYSKSEFKKENEDIRQDMKGITTSQDRIEKLEAKLEKDRAAKDKMACIADRKNLAKAKADLKREKAYLRADKKDLRQDHNYVVCKSKAEVRKEKRELQASKAQLRKDLRKDNSFALHDDINAIERNQRELDVDLAVLEDKQEARKTELAAVNEELVDSGIRDELVIFQGKADREDKTKTAQVEPKLKAKVDDGEVTAVIDEDRLYPRWMKQ